MPGFQKLYPEITMDLLVSDSRVDLIVDKIDVAVRVGPLADSSLITRKLGEVRRVIVASPDYIQRRGEPKTACDLASHNCLSLQGFPRLAKWPMYVDGKRKLMAVSGSVTSDSADVLLDLAIAGIGIVRLGDFLGREAIQEGKIISLLEGQHDEDATPINVLMPPGRQHVPRVKAFVDFLQARMKV
jgi:DNA-binding transcriptional LysR family regulator